MDVMFVGFVDAWVDCVCNDGFVSLSDGTGRD